MVEKSYYRDYGFKDWYEALGQEAREKFKEWLGDIREKNNIRSESINYEYGKSYSNDLYRAGHTLVYLYTNNKGVPFYVGKGFENRALSIYNRSDAFKERLMETDSCRIFAVAFDVMDEDALKIETLCINELINRGWRLTNGNKVSVSQDTLNELRSDYPDVIDTLNRIQSVTINCWLDDIDYFNGVGEVVVNSKSSVKSKKTDKREWVINMVEESK